jgi:hypothetical protein
MMCAPASRFEAKLSIAGVETTSSKPAATSRIGWRKEAGKPGDLKRFITRIAASAQATVGRPSASNGSASMTATLRA